MKTPPPRPLQNSKPNRPNLFIVGAPKCGTTSLHAYLRTHPQIHMSDIKEPHYFCDDFPGLRRFPTRTEYLQLFDDAGPKHLFVGEATSRYLYSQTAIANILKFDQKAKFVAMLRNPVELVPSLHAQLVYQFSESEKDFETAWRLQGDRQSGKQIPANCPEPAELQYGAVARLGEQIGRLFQVVPREQIHLIFFDDFRSNPARAYHQVLDFLDLPDDGRGGFEQANPHKRYRSGWLAKLMFNPPTPLRQIKQGLKRTFGWQETRFGRWAYGRLTVPARRSALTPDLQRELVDHFQDDIQELEALTGRDLSAWRTIDRVQGQKVA